LKHLSSLFSHPAVRKDPHAATISRLPQAGPSARTKSV
jgi:hypothetical protein